MSRLPQNGYRNMSAGSQPSLSNPSAMSSTTRLATPTMPAAAAHRPSSPNVSITTGGSSPGVGQGHYGHTSRAERFEDEKRRIIESCFSKLDANAQLAESYITHIRIVEDSAFPSAPPPPESIRPENQKPRLIIIAVRSTGRVRMHKARENNNGSFSIGKTWNLEELSAIESFSNAPNDPPLTEKEAQHRAWAGSVGFIVTISKPYYWQAGTSKEKDFFIASAVKIYRKYTKGQIPELRGFDEKSRAMMLGVPPGQQPPPIQQGPPQMGTRVVSEDDFGTPPAPPQPAFAQRPHSREESRYRQSPGPPPDMNELRPPPSLGSRQPSESPSRRIAPSPVPGQRPFASQEQMDTQSREGSVHEHAGARPGRSAQPPLQLPTMPSGQSQSRDGSPGISSVSSTGREPVPKALRPHSPPRHRQHSIPEDTAQAQPSQQPQQQQQNITNGTQSGAALLFATRQRWMGHQQQQQQQPSAQAQNPPTSLTSRLPPIETSQVHNDVNNVGQRQSSADYPQTAVSAASGASSAGIDPGDAAAIAALTNFWGPESTEAAAITPTAPPSQTPISHAPWSPIRSGPPEIQEPGSPPTPERSARRQRPPIEGRPSDASFDLRPPPLAQAGTRTPDTQNSAYATPHEGASVAGTPKSENPPDVEPLAVANKATRNSDGSMAVPGAFQDSPVGPSPSGTPAETPGDERGEQELLQREREEAEQYRPGLGPMIKKNAVRDRFKKAANAAGAFKPRPGGAAEKIMKAKAEREGTSGLAAEPDGITGVVLPRSGAGVSAKKEEKSVAASAAKDGLAVQDLAPPTVATSDRTPKAEVSSSLSPAQVLDNPGVMDDSQHANQHHQSVSLTDNAVSQAQRQQTPAQEEHEQQQHPGEGAEKQRTIDRRQPQVKIKRRSERQEKYLVELGVDPNLLEGRGLEFEQTLEDFGWKDEALRPQALADMEADLRREQARLEAGSWLSHDDPAREEKVEQVAALIDKAIAECDELEGLLTLYNVELGSLNDDIAFIEAQSQGLQVQSANQKLLYNELSNLLETVSLDRRVLDTLQQGDLADVGGLEEVEACLVRLYQAMVTIDPSVRAVAGNTRPKSRSGMSGEGANEVSQMRALREKKDVYARESDAFVQRLMQYLDHAFATAFSGAKSRAMQSTTAGGGTVVRLNKDAYGDAKRKLWVYGPVLLYAKEMNAPAWATLLRMYCQKAQPVYADTFKDNLAGWKRAVGRKAGAEEEGVLFTSAEKEDGASGSGMAAARKLTVKRSQTLAKTLRNASGGSGRDRSGSFASGSMMSSEVFAGAVDEMAPLVSQEQNFLMELFHASGLEQGDFMDLVARTPPDARIGKDVRQPMPMDPDREMARQVMGAMDGIFSLFAQEMGKLLEWAVGGDPIQGVGVMACLSKHAFFLQDSSQEFLLRMLGALTDRLTSLWAKFVDEQVRAIEDTKVKIKKRKGVIGFVKVFPHFSGAVENVFSAVAQEAYEGPAESMRDVRRLVDEAYERINRAMFDCLKAIAKESPNAPGAAGARHGGVGAGSEDSEDKEMLNYHILLIENMNHYVEEVDDGGREGSLASWRGKAMMERIEALNAYVGMVIRRPLGKLLVSLPCRTYVNCVSLLMHDRTSSTPPSPCSPRTPQTQPPSPPDPPILAKPRATCSRSTTARKSGAASRRCANVSRSTSVTRVRKSSRGIWWRWCVKRPEGRTSERSNARRGLSGRSTRRPKGRRRLPWSSRRRMYRLGLGDEGRTLRVDGECREKTCIVSGALRGVRVLLQVRRDMLEAGMGDYPSVIDGESWTTYPCGFG